jgi:hypothetical protein
MTTAMLFFLLKKNLGYYATMCHILIDAELENGKVLCDWVGPAQRLKATEIIIRRIETGAIHADIAIRAVSN